MARKYKKKVYFINKSQNSTVQIKKEMHDDDVSGFVPDDEMQLWQAVHALKSGTAVTTGGIYSR